MNDRNHMVIGRMVKTPRPYKNESFMGFLLRVTEENHYDNPYWILQLAGIELGRWNESAYIYKSPSSLQTFSVLTNVSIRTLRNMMIQAESLPVTDYVGDYKLFGLEFPFFSVRFGNTKICPECLKEANYIRKIWSVVLVTVCPIHHIILIDKCPRCGNRIGWYRSAVSVCSCNFDFRNSEVIKADADGIRLTHNIHERCGLTKKDVTLSLTQDNPIHSLDLKKLLQLILFVASYFRDRLSESILASPGLDNGRLHLLLTKAYAVFRDWPNGYYHYLDYLQLRDHRANAVTGIRKAFGNYYYHLYRKYTDHSFEFMRLAFETYLEDQWTGGYLNLHTMYHQLIGRYVTGRKAAKTLGIKRVKIPMLIEKGMLKGIVKKNKSRTFYLVDKSSLIKLKQKYDKAFTARDAARKLNISLRNLYALVRNGSLESLRGPASDGQSYLYIHSSALKTLMVSLAKRIENPNKQPLYKSLKFYKATRIVRMTTASLVRAVLDGKIKLAGQTHGRGLQSFRLTLDEITNYLRNNKATKDTISLSDATLSIGAPWKKNFLRNRFCSAQETNNICRIPIAEWSTFKESYVTPGELVRGLGIRTFTLIDLLAKKGIFPITGPKVNGSDLYLFRRNDLAGLDMAKLVTDSLAFSDAMHIIGASPNNGFLRNRFCSSLIVNRSCRIPIAEWSSFRETYVTPAELVRDLGIRTFTLIDLLAKKGISPITGLKVDGSDLYLFKRTDLAGFNIAGLVADSKLANQ
jgi:TniQ protein